MNLEIVDIRSVEKELQTQIGQFKNFALDFQPSDPLKTLFNEMLAIIHAYNNIILKLKHSYRFNHYINDDFSAKVLLLSEVKPEFFNNIQILSEKLQLPIHVILNALMTAGSVKKRTTNQTSADINLDYDNLKQFLKQKPSTEISVSNKDFIEVLRSDVADQDLRYNFSDIDILIIKNISIEEFQNTIGTISYCKTVFVPDHIPKLLIYSKIHHVDTIQAYTSLDDVYDAVFIFK